MELIFLLFNKTAHTHEKNIININILWNKLG